MRCSSARRCSASACCPQASACICLGTSKGLRSSLGSLKGPVLTASSVRDRLDQLFKQRIVIIDGSIGLLLQHMGLTEEDVRGELMRDHPTLLRNHVDVLNLTPPETGPHA